MIIAAAPHLGRDSRAAVDQLMNNFLPDRPEDLFIAAQLVDRNLSPKGPARPLLVRAQTLLADRPEGLSAEQYYLKARVSQALDELTTAARAYNQALRIAPQQVGWRIEYANMLKELRQWKDAQREFTRVLKDRPNDQDIKDSLKEVERQIKISPPPP
jgi:tetratricopeptide (TPR) repeat protein